MKPIDKYLRQAEYDNPQRTHNCFNVNALLEAKSNLSLTTVRPPGSHKSSLTYENPFGNFLYLYSPKLKIYNQSLPRNLVQLFSPMGVLNTLHLGGGVKKAGRHLFEMPNQGDTPRSPSFYRIGTRLR